jgi:hypothetical protein
VWERWGDVSREMCKRELHEREKGLICLARVLHVKDMFVWGREERERNV